MKSPPFNLVTYDLRPDPGFTAARMYVNSNGYLGMGGQNPNEMVHLYGGGGGYNPGESFVYTEIKRVYTELDPYGEENWNE